MQSIDTFMADWSSRQDAPAHTSRAKIYEHLLVELTKSARDNKTVRINHIKSTYNRSGDLRTFLKWITGEADQKSFSLTMAVQPSGRHFEDAPNKDKLKTVAEKYGFRVKFEYPDNQGYEMERN